jgi:hypothetical protein
MKFDLKKAAPLRMQTCAPSRPGIRSSKNRVARGGSYDAEC